MSAVIETKEEVTLYYREGSSDKVYQAAIEPNDGGFVVEFAYGRRGSTLTTGTKTSSPVNYDTARKIFTKLVNEKKAKGYTEGENGTPYQHTDKQSSGILPQLLNPVDGADAHLLLYDDNYCAQEKFDGKHLLIRKQGDKLEGINKKGLVIGLPETIAGEIGGLSGSFILDGESVGDEYHGLKAAFGRFGEDVLQILAALEKYFEEIQEQLEERQEHWRRQVDEAENQVYAARRALDVCEDSGYYDEEGDYQAPNCSSEEDYVYETERHLVECENNLETVKQWRHRIEGQIADFQGDMHRLSNLASSRTSSVQAFLANKIEILDRYVGGNTQGATSLPANIATTITNEKSPTQLQNKTKHDKIQNSFERAKFGRASRVDYKKTFEIAYPFLKDRVVVHHAVPQYVLTRYRGLVTKEEIHSLENLRGIPTEIVNDFHASLLNSEWNRFYRENPTTTKERLLEKATEIDSKYGHNFLPPTGIKNP